MNIGVIVLAAGGSSRMGTAKQLLVYQGKTLLRRAVEAGIEVGCSPVVVVLGQDAQRMRAELDELPIVIALNAEWQQGMGGSLRIGMEHLEEHSACDAALVTLCDQPLVSSSVIRRLLETYEKKKPPLAAASYARTLGVPAIFSRQYFQEILELPPASGAKPILLRHMNEVLPVAMEEAATDIDTPADYQRLKPKA